MTNSVSSGTYHVWIDRMYNKQTNKQFSISLFIVTMCAKLSDFVTQCRIQSCVYVKRLFKCIAF